MAHRSVTFHAEVSDSTFSQIDQWCDQLEQFKGNGVKKKALSTSTGQSDASIGNVMHELHHHSERKRVLRRKTSFKRETIIGQSDLCIEERITDHRVIPAVTQKPFDALFPQSAASLHFVLSAIFTPGHPITTSVGPLPAAERSHVSILFGQISLGGGLSPSLWASEGKEIPDSALLYHLPPLECATRHCIDVYRNGSDRLSNIGLLNQNDAMRYIIQDRRIMRAPCLSFPCASVFLSTFLITALSDTAAADESKTDASTSIWQFDIFTDPAPAPEDGPPLSASALRDKSLLPAEIGGIVGSYVVFVAFSLCALFFIGRRLRRAAQTSNRSLDVEMVRPSKPPTLNTASPVSPVDRWVSPTSTTDSRIWPSPVREKSHWNTMSWSNVSRGHRSQPSQDGSVATFDENVVQSDRKKAQDEMERLYAAVMDHDEQKERMSNASKSPISPTEGPPEFRHLRSPGLAQHQYHQINQQQQQPYTVQEEPGTNLPPSSPRMGKRLSRLSGLSFLSSSSRSTTATSSRHRPSRISVRDLPISPPLGSPDVRRTGVHTEEQQPLSPRIYTPGPPPPNPSQRTRQGSAVSTTSPTLHPPARHRPTHNTAGSSTSTLPFRSAFSPPQSAPPTKTTILEREEMRNGPRTGIPQTPYSPYMPFTPITPITPSHFVTRKDRRQREKDSGMRVLHEDDMVMSDEDMWGS
ncbi:hypothetical protein FQN54_005618 [Arachnomyces sp. PD_36]|nr:hypothetical protein FQN54_005618 [Arachnomyces sp. PD_36]